MAVVPVQVLVLNSFVIMDGFPLGPGFEQSLVELLTTGGFVGVAQQFHKAVVIGQSRRAVR